MKKSKAFKLIGVIILSLAAMLIVGCDGFLWWGEDSPEYTITVSVVGEGGTISPSGTIQVDEGSNMTFYLTSEIGYNPLVSVNNGNASLTDNTITLSNISSNYDIEVKFEKTNLWYMRQDLMNGEWKWDTLVSKNTEGRWVYTVIWGESNHTQEQLVFLANGEVSITWDGKYLGNDNWDIDDTKSPAVLNWGGTPHTIEKLDESSMVLSVIPYSDSGSGFGSEIKLIYSHHN